MARVLMHRGLGARVFAIMLAALSGACAFIQPTSRGAPMADTVGAVLMTGATAGTIAAYRDPSGNGQDFTQDQGYEAGVITLGTLALLYTLSAVYGFTQDPATQNSKEPILGLRILSLGLLGAARGLQNVHSQSGCCSYHGGDDHCELDGQGDNRVVCADGRVSPTCLCQ